MAEAVKVIVRCRPMNQREKDLNCKMVVTMDQGVICNLTSPEGKETSDPPKSFTFDGAYHIDSTTENIYNDVGFPIVESVLEGYNGTVFAYGQTGCGKSFSMQGITDPPTQRGIIPRAFEHIFEMIQTAEDMKYLVMASYLEIYNEDIRDLLGVDAKKKLDLKEHPDKGVYVNGLSQHPVHNTSECEHLMETGWGNRATGATLMNKDSSRSHSIFTITLEMMSTTGDDTIRSGKLNLVDLAGSERQAKTGATGDRLKEATKINLSLSALGNVISALVDGRSKHIPYRDSKLTRLLQDSLGGNTKTLMVACLSPADNNYDETLSTLRYANRAKNIKNKPKINEDPKDAMLREYQEEIQKLKEMLESQGGGGGGIVGNGTGLGAPALDEEALEKEREKVRLEFEEQVEKLRKEKEAEEQSKQAMQSEVDDIRQKYEEQIAKLAEQSRLQQEEFERKQKELHEQQELAAAAPGVPGAPGRRASKPGQPGAGGAVVDGYEEDWETETVGDSEEMGGQESGPPATTGVLKMTNTQQYSLSNEQKVALKRLREIQEKMVGGEKKEDTELKAKRQKRKKYMEKRLKILSEALKDVDEEDGIMLKVYDDIHEELRVKTDLAKKQKQKIKSLEAEIEDITSEFQNERTDYLETIRKLDQQTKLLQGILEKVQPTIRRDCNYSNVDAIKKEATWDDEYQRWRLPDLAIVKTKLPPAGIQPGGRTGGATAAGNKGGSSSPWGFTSSWLLGASEDDLPNGYSSNGGAGERSSDDSPDDWTAEREVKSDGYLKKLQRGAVEDIAGNYFKPKRANELLVRFQEDPGVGRKHMNKKNNANSGGLGMSMSQSMWGTSLSNSLGNAAHGYNNSWGSNNSSSASIVGGNGYGNTFGGPLGQSFAASNATGSHGIASTNDVFGGQNNNGWFGSTNSQSTSSLSPDSFKKPGKLGALQPRSKTIGSVGAGAGAVGLTGGGGGGGPLSLSSFGTGSLGLSSSMTASQRFGNKKTSKDDLDTLLL